MIKERMLISDEKVRSFKKNGFVLGDKVLDDCEIDVLRNEMERVIEERNRTDIAQPVQVTDICRDDDKSVWQIVNIWMASEPFKNLVMNPFISDAIKRLGGHSENRIWHDQIQYKPAEDGGQNDWHQDAPYWAPLEAETMISAWVALDDADEENGCMSMVPGSHLWGDQIKYLHRKRDAGCAFNKFTENFDNRMIKPALCPVKKGEVHFHHALTWHGSQKNTSGRPRRALAIHFINEHTLFNELGSHCCKEFIESKNGEKVVGEYLPLI